MSLKTLLAAKADEVFRGYLNQEYIRDPVTKQQVRLRAGGYERAIEATLNSMHNLSRRDPTYFRDSIAPQVRQSLNAARRLNANEAAGPASIGPAPGHSATRNDQYEYLIRGRATGHAGYMGQETLVVIRSDKPLSQAELRQQGREKVTQGDVHHDYLTRVHGIDASNLLEWATISAYRVSP